MSVEKRSHRGRQSSGEAALFLSAAHKFNLFCSLFCHFNEGSVPLARSCLQEDQTPLHIASRLGKTEIVQLLLQHMAHPDAATTNGYTPLHISAREGQLETASVLLEAGASHSLATKVDCLWLCFSLSFQLVATCTHSELSQAETSI